MDAQQFADELNEELSYEASLHEKMAVEADGMTEKRKREAKASAFRMAAAMVNEKAPTPSLEKEVKGDIEEAIEGANRDKRIDTSDSAPGNHD